jgi:Domain of Unknown Function (DUF1080)
MNLSRLLLAAAVALSANAARADDTKEFLDPKNWEGRSDIWYITDGVVVGYNEEDPKYNTFFCSKKKYSDFDISFKVQLKDGKGNSGLQIRSKLTDEKLFKVAGPQVDAGAGYWGSLYGEGVGGMMKASKKEDIAKAVKETEWNEYHVVAKGTKITITINGTTMVDDDFKMLPGKEKDKAAPTEGIIAFQYHAGHKGMRVSFKDIKFTNLAK